MTLFIAQIINGLILGGIYALLVAGFNLLLLEGGIFQYAYPHLLILSMYCCWWVLGITNDNLFLGVSAAAEAPGSAVIVIETKSASVFGIMPCCRHCLNRSVSLNVLGSPESVASSRMLKTWRQPRQQKE